MFAEPRLPLLAEVESVEQIRAGTGDGPIGDGAEVRDREWQFRRLGEEQEADRCTRCARETLELAVCRVPLFPLPSVETRKAFLKALRRDPGALACPPEELRTNGLPASSSGHRHPSIVISSRLGRVRVGTRGPESALRPDVEPLVGGFQKFNHPVEWAAEEPKIPPCGS